MCGARHMRGLTQLTSYVEAILDASWHIRCEMPVKNHEKNNNKKQTYE